ncbi:MULTISPECIES: hypothetical protein [unclassified Arthrobacter]|uniref:hypothetical protein n=1 Tax=unclassified Arthrobacter TaxID=235627 RepID=UPI001C8515D4|nr:hypothetical protein [Arthrobacter sp. MAHUQ-56]MBX7442918.1 hypothetical protein [Arthrobacter sp. MAHUQ-56]
MAYDYEQLYKTLTRRYGDVSPEALIKVLCPMHVPIATLDKTIHKLPGQQHWRATFTAAITSESQSVLSVGRTGKFIAAGHLNGAAWKEVAKGRILSISSDGKTAIGEVYVGSKRSDLELAVQELCEADFLEIDQFGASAKILSALAESSLATSLEEAGYAVRRMPEDTAKHIGNYANYDFEVTRDGVTKKVEVKSLWGTDTRYARLIHSTGRDYPTSSCKFATQDFFAVSLFLRTGDISDFAFARSRPDDESPNHLGLPRARKFPDHVNQNPLCTLGTGVWFSSLDDVWDLP